MTDRIFTAPVVIDFGSQLVKCGYAGESCPRHIAPSPAPAFSNRESPSSTDWEGVLIPFFIQLYNTFLGCNPKEHTVVMCEAFASPAPLRDALAVVLLDHLRVPAIHIAPGPYPALYCTHAHTGIVLDIGFQEAHVLATFRGMPMHSTYVAVPRGVRAVQQRLLQLLGGEEGTSNVSDADLADVTARACLCAVGRIPSVEQVSPVAHKTFAGKTIDVPASARLLAADALFEEDEEGNSLATALLDCLQRCPPDNRRELASHVLVIGGGAMMPGVCGRLHQEVVALAHREGSRYQWASRLVTLVTEPVPGRDPSKRLCIVQSAFPRSTLLWLGASIMATLETMEEHYLSRQEFLENGHRLPDWLSINPADWMFLKPRRPGPDAPKKAAA